MTLLCRLPKWIQTFDRTKYVHAYYVPTTWYNGHLSWFVKMLQRLHNKQFILLWTKIRSASICGCNSNYHYHYNYNYNYNFFSECPMNSYFLLNDESSVPAVCSKLCPEGYFCQETESGLSVCCSEDPLIGERTFLCSRPFLTSQNFFRYVRPW